MVQNEGLDMDHIRKCVAPFPHLTAQALELMLMELWSLHYDGKRGSLLASCYTSHCIQKCASTAICIQCNEQHRCM